VRAVTIYNCLQNFQNIHFTKQILIVKSLLSTPDRNLTPIHY
jgi:hypothetical protein